MQDTHLYEHTHPSLASLFSGAITSMYGITPQSLGALSCLKTTEVDHSRLQGYGARKGS